MELRFKRRLGPFSAKLSAALVFLCALSVAAHAEQTVALSANHPDAVSEIASQGTAPGYRPLKMEIFLAPRNQAQLDQLLQEQQDPSSPKYHQFLTPDQYDQQFGPTAADVSAITQWLTSEGFTVKFASAHERRISFSGDVATAQSAFWSISRRVATARASAISTIRRFRLHWHRKSVISPASTIFTATVWNTLIPDPPYDHQRQSPSPLLWADRHQDIRAMRRP